METALRSTTFFVVCCGHSMSPTILLGQRVEASALTGAHTHVAVGDVVLLPCADGSDEVLHRLVCQVPFVPYYVHRGDAASCRPGFVRADRLTARTNLPRRAPSPRQQLGSLLSALRCSFDLRMSKIAGGRQIAS